MQFGMITHLLFSNLRFDQYLSNCCEIKVKIVYFFEETQRLLIGSHIGKWESKVLPTIHDWCIYQSVIWSELKESIGAKVLSLPKCETCQKIDWLRLVWVFHSSNPIGTVLVWFQPATGTELHIWNSCYPLQRPFISKKYFRPGGMALSGWMHSFRAVWDTLVADYSASGFNSMSRIPYYPLTTASQFLFILSVSYFEWSISRWDKL
jgi:hypothetical protein